MSGGLYSMEEKDYDKNLNLKAIKPYGCQYRPETRPWRLPNSF